MYPSEKTLLVYILAQVSCMHCPAWTQHEDGIIRTPFCFLLLTDRKVFLCPLWPSHCWFSFQVVFVHRFGAKGYLAWTTPDWLLGSSNTNDQTTLVLWRIDWLSGSKRCKLKLDERKILHVKCLFALTSFFPHRVAVTKESGPLAFQGFLKLS